MKRLTKLADLLDRAMYILVFFSFGLLLCAVLIICIAVFSRYVINKPFVWVEQISGYILVYIVFLNAAWVLKKNRHIKLDILLNSLNPKTQTLFNIVTSFLGAIVCLVITWYGVDVTWDYFQRGVPSVEVLRVPLFTIWWVIPVGGFLLFIQFLRRAYSLLASLRTTADQRQI